jgi:hypothetical protein
MPTRPIVERNGYAVGSGGIVGGTLVRILSALRPRARRSSRCDMSGLIHQVIPAAGPAPDQVERSTTNDVGKCTRLARMAGPISISRSHSSSAAEASRRDTHSEYATPIVAPWNSPYHGQHRLFGWQERQSRKASAMSEFAFWISCDISVPETVSEFNGRSE